MEDEPEVTQEVAEAPKAHPVDEWFNAHFCNCGLDTATYNIIYSAKEDLKARLG